MEQLITENDHYQHVARENCGAVIIKVTIMKPEITQLHCKHINNTYSKEKLKDIVIYKL